MALITVVGGPTTLTDQNISAGLLVFTYTNTVRIRKLYVNVELGQVAGGGDYIAYITRQKAGAGVFYESIRSTKAAAAGVVSVWFDTIPIILDATDVIRVYVIGLPADIATPDITTTVYEEYVLTDATGQVTIGAIANNAITGASIDPSADAQIADAVWDEVITVAFHNIVNSAGRRLRLIGSFSLADGQAQGGTANSITLEVGSSATNHMYEQNLISITSGPGAGQTRLIAEYIGGASLIAYVDRLWDIQPTNLSFYEITAFNGILLTQHGLALGPGAGNNHIQLAASALAIDDLYNGSMIVLRTGVGPGQARTITDYVGATKIAEVTPDWTTNPDATTVYEIIPFGVAPGTIFPSGAIAFTYTLTSDVLPNPPIQGADVWFSTDAGGLNIVWRGVTDAFGVARDVNNQLPFLDAGTYRVWRQKSGWTFVNPDIEVVS